MTPERYAEITRLCQPALELNASQRAAFLSQACAGDDELRSEVEELLAADEAEDSFIDQPALNAAAHIFAHEQPSLIGKQLGNYQILQRLGVGGMGEVFLAEDARLKRKVALKLLPATFTQDSERARRFEREAQAASALNHPNILTIYDFGQAELSSGNLHYIVMEYIEGVTLRQRLSSGRMPIPEALSIVKQIAAALDKAHQARILHRDIKPENVMLRPDGIVKVLDFGLAKLAAKDKGGRMDESEQGNPAHPSSLIPHPSQTASGMVMGTPRYMSPEQARGLKVDARTDVFSLGVVLYEMVTGEPAFAGPSTAEVFVALLEKEPPPLRQFVAEVPDSLQAIISKMLAKDREQRYATMHDLRDALTQIDAPMTSGSKEQMALPANGLHGNERSNQPRQTTPEAVQATTSNRPLSLWQRPRLQWLTVALVLTGVVSFVGYRWLAAHNSTTKQPAGEPKFTPLIGLAGKKHNPAISPDETRIAFAWDGGRGEEISPGDIYVKVIGTDGPPQRLTTAPEDDSHPCWTPDGKYVTFVRHLSGKREVLRVPANGGPEQKLAETASAAAWSPDSKMLVVSGSPDSAESTGIFLYNLETHQYTRLTKPEPPIMDTYPHFSPDGKMVSFTRDFGSTLLDIFIVPASGGTPQQLTFDKCRISGQTWTSDSREIVFSAIRSGNRGLWRVSVQGGAPVRVPVNGQNSIDPEISQQGNKLIWTERSTDANLWLYQSAGFAGREVPGKFSAPLRLPLASFYEEQSPSFSPDGQKVVFSSDRTSKMELWTSDSEGKTAALQLTRAGVAGSPRWSYDGQWIAFDSSIEGKSNVYVMSATGEGPWRRVTTEKMPGNLPAWSRDGQWIYFRSSVPGSGQLYKMPAAGGEARQLTFNGGFEGFESPDGKLFYYSKGRGVYGIYSVPVNGGEEKLVPELKDAGYWRSWTVVSEGICFPIKKSEGEWAIQFFSFATRRITTLFTVTDAPLWWTPGLAMSEDGRRLMYAHLEHPYDELMMMENFH